jgi:hypothetical protein
MKAEVAIRADVRRKALDPHDTTHTEAGMNSGVVTALMVKTTA